MQKIYELSYELKSLLDQDERVILLNQLEEEMNNSEEVMALAYKKDMSVDKYNDVLRFFGKDSVEAKNAKKELYIAKKNLDEHPLVRKYLDTYSELRDIYLQINSKLFSILDESLCEK